MKYYLAGVAVRNKLKAENKRSAQVLRKARKLARALGAVDCFWDHARGECQLSGFDFAEPPDPARFKKLAGTETGYEPKRTKANQELRARMTELHRTGSRVVGEIVGLKVEWKWATTDHGRPGLLMLGKAGCEWFGEKCVIVINKDDKQEPQGCKRISDLAYEALQKQPTKSKTKR
jgi:hypothetical protein